MAVQHAYTLEEFERFVGEHPWQRFELIHGEIVERQPTILQGYLVALLAAALMNYWRPKRSGYPLVKAAFRLNRDDYNLRIPDLSFIANDKGALVSKGAAPFMPDLAVEVQSPGQSDKFMADKAAYYLANGSRMVWLVYPAKQIVEVLTPSDRQLLREDGTLSGGDVLPGFTFPIRDWFVEA